MNNIAAADKAHLHTREAAAAVPLRVSLVTGFFVSASITVILLTIGYFRMVNVLKFGLVSFVVVSTIAWLYLQYRLIILTGIEQATGLDLFDDVPGPEPSSPKKPSVVDVWLHTQNGPYRQAERAQFPISDEDMLKFAKGLLEGTPLLQENWCGKAEGKLFSLDEFRAVREVLLERKLIVLKNSNKRGGYVLTPDGVKAMRDIVDKLSPTPPSKNTRQK